MLRFKLSSLTGFCLFLLACQSLAHNDLQDPLFSAANSLFNYDIANKVFQTAEFPNSVDLINPYQWARIAKVTEHIDNPSVSRPADGYWPQGHALTQKEGDLDTDVLKFDLNTDSAGKKHLIWSRRQTFAGGQSQDYASKEADRVTNGIQASFEGSYNFCAVSMNCKMAKGDFLICASKVTDDRDVCMELFPDRNANTVSYFTVFRVIKKL